MKNLFITICVIASSIQFLSAQCTVQMLASDNSITCGECVTLSAFGSGSGSVAFQENFNSGSPIGWGFTQTTTIANNTCGVPSPDGTAFMWMGNAAANPRDMTTVSLNLTAGGTVCFEMRYAVQGDASPCEGPDEPTEGVYIQYSINSGATWVTIQYWDPNNIDEAWHDYCVNIPLAARTTNTRIRWHQDAVTSADYDHWGIDNVRITLADPTYNITIPAQGGNTATSFGPGVPGGTHPGTFCPQNTTTYNVSMTNGTQTCTGTVTVTVVDPTIIVQTPSDQAVCGGGCVSLPSQAYELVSPASTPTFNNNEPNVSIVTPQSPLTLPCTSFGGCACPTGGTVSFGATCPPTPGQVNASADLSVSGLNGNNLASASATNGPSAITSVCVNSFVMPGFGCPNLNLADVRIVLIHPNGTQVILANVGSLAGTTILNMCFSLTGGAAISTGAGSNYTGTFTPQNSWAVLNGLASEGLWQLAITGSNTELCLSTVALTGWSMTFNDPLITSPVNFVWTPTTNMTASTTLNPNVCPTATTIYTLSATDTDGCNTVTDAVTVTVTPTCCTLAISGTVNVQPTCTTTTGSSTISITGAVGTVEYSSNGTTYQSSNVFPTLAPGTYTMHARQVGGTCDVTVSVIINPIPLNPTISSATPTQPTCGTTTGAITLVGTGGTGALTFSNNNGASFQGTGTFSALAAGSYQMIVRDANGCQATQTVVLTAPNSPTITSATPTQPSCGTSNGAITVVAAGGTGTITFSNNNGASFQATGSFTALPAGSYVIVVRDANLCTATQTVVLTAPNAPTITSATPTQPTCGASNGAIAVVAAGGTGTITFSNNNGVSFQATGSFTALAAGSYVIVIRDGNLCTATQTVLLTAPNAPTITTISDPDALCAGGTGSITVSATGGTGALQYSFDNGATFQSGATLSAVAPGTYTVVVRDVNLCTASGTATINAGLSPTFGTVTPTQPTCGASDGAITANVSGGTGTLQVSFNNGTTFANVFAGALSTSGLASGSYTLVVRDANLCQATQVVSLSASGAPTITVAFTNATCSASDGTITITSTGTPSYSIDGGVTTQITNNFTGLSAGTYAIEVTEAGCTATASQVIGGGTNPTITITPTNPFCLTGTGSLAVVASGGTGTYEYSFNNGTTFGAATSQTGLAIGTYNIVVRTIPNNCQVTGTGTISAGTNPTITSITPTQPTCGNSNGQLVVAAAGNPTFTYSFDNGVSFGSSSTQSSLSAGSFTIIVRDVNTCEVSQTATLTAVGGPTLNASALTQPTCGLNNGALTINASSTVTSFSINGGTSTQATGSFTALASGTYNIQVADANGCIATATETLNASSAAVISSITAGATTCGLVNGTLTVNPNTFSTYSIDGGATSQATNQFTGLASGNYTVIATNASGCVATLTATINAGAIYTINAGADQTLCSGATATLTGPTAPATYVWSNGVSNGIPFTPITTTTYTLTATNSLGCVATDNVDVIVNFGPALNDQPEIEGCAPLLATFASTSNTSNCLWNFGDGTTSTNCTTITHLYTTPGLYDITLTATGLNGCITTSVFPQIVTVSSDPIAQFTALPAILSLSNTTTTLVNNSINASNYIWDFGDTTGISTAFEPAHQYTFNYPGTYVVTLIAINGTGCRDTATSIVTVNEDLLYYVPNTFTPDDNEFNQAFTPVFTAGFDPQDYTLSIFNRWGEIIFESRDKDIGWDGTYLENLVKEGVYIWKIEFKTLSTDARQIATGHLNLLR